MAKFECKHTGCVYEWTDEQIISDMRKHSEYKELVAVPAPAPIAAKPKKVKGELA
jgi:hypothetical protein